MIEESKKAKEGLVVHKSIKRLVATICNIHIGVLTRSSLLTKRNSSCIQSALNEIKNSFKLKKSFSRCVYLSLCFYIENALETFSLIEQLQCNSILNPSKLNFKVLPAWRSNCAVIIC